MRLFEPKVAEISKWKFFCKYCDYGCNKKTDFKEVIKVITNKTGIKKVSKEDILTNNYFQKKLSLFQNIRFYSTLANISLESFVSEYSLKEQFGVLKNNNFEEIGPDIWFKYEILLYLFTNKFPF